MIKSIFNEIKGSKFQILIFILCIIVATSTFISIESLRFSVQDYVDQDSKVINGGDVIVESNREYPDDFRSTLSSVDGIKSDSLSFSSIVLSKLSNQSLLSQIRIVDGNYPLYGDVVLASGRNYFDVMNKDSAVVQQDYLTRTGAKIGSVIQIGSKDFTIADVLVTEPDYPLNLFQLGPRILILNDSLNDLNLIGDKSRVEYKTLIKTNFSTDVIRELNSTATNRIDIDDNLNANNTLNTFVLNFLLFIKLISLLVIVLSGIAITSVIMSYLNDKKDSIAIKKILGQTNKNIILFYFTTVVFVSLIALLLSVSLSYLFVNMLGDVFANIIPESINTTLSMIAVSKGLVFSLFITCIFTLYPILSISEVKPLQILKKQPTDSNYAKLIGVNFLVLLFFIIVVFVEIGIGLVSVYIIIASLIALGILYYLSHLILRVLKWARRRVGNLSLRHALSGLYRIGNKTALIITTLSLSLIIIFVISFLQINLQNQFIVSFPPDAPNVFVVDIPKNNLSGVSELLGDATIYPVVRGRLLSVNGQLVEDIERTNGQGDPLTRQYSLTYGDLLESERIISTREADSIFVSNWNSELEQVSVLSDVAERFNGKLGDILVFRIQGVEIEAEIVSIRERLERNIGAFFYFTFEKDVLFDAPQTMFSTLKTDVDRIPQLQNEIFQKYPSVTVINAATTAKTVGDIIGQLSKIITLFTMVSLIAGILILISSIVSTNEQRSKQAVFYRLVGANNRFISKVFIFEYFIVGLLCVLIALVFSQLIVYLLTHYVLNIDYLPLIGTSLVYGLITILVIVLLGFAMSYRVLFKKPIEFIRENDVQ